MNIRKQQELERISWFRGKKVKQFSEKQIREYFDWSENGIGDGGILACYKQSQGITIKSWEHGIIEGYTPYWTLLGGEDKKEVPPRHIVEFIKKQIFKGIDADLIEKVYQEIIHD